jgi:hypothetical protein
MRRIPFARGPIVGFPQVMNQSPQSALEDARSEGIDLDMLDTNLALSVKERWMQHEQANELALKLQTAGEALNAKLQSTTGTTI